MSEQGSTAIFDLVFEGPSNDSLQTIQKIKGVFLAHMELPIPEIQKILESAPTIIKSSAHENDLKQIYHLLKNAGAKVLLVKKGGDADSDETSDSSEDGFTFEMPLEPEQSEEPRPTKVYSLDMDDESVEQALSSLIDETPAPESETETLETESVPTMTLNSLTESPVPVEQPPPEPVQAAPLVEENSLLLALDETMNKVEQVLESTSEAPTNSAEPTSPHSSEKESSLFLALDETMSKVEEALQTKSDPPLPSAALASHPPAEAVKQENSLALSFEDDSKPAISPQPAPASNPPLKTEDSMNLEIKFDDDRRDSPPLKVEEPEPVARPEDSRVKEVVASEPPKTDPPAPPAAEAKPPPAVMDIVPSPAPTLKESFSNPSKEKSSELMGQITSTESEEPTTPTRKRFAFLGKIPVDVALPVLVGAGILISANLYYFSQNNPENKPNKDFMMDDPLAEIEKKNASKTKDTPIEAPKAYNVEEVTDTYKVVASIITKEKNLPALTFTIMTPALPELTKEEIVQGKIQEPWLRRLETAELLLKPQDGVAILRADGSAMAYIEYKANQTRLIGSVFVTAQLNEDKDAYAVTVQIKSPGIEDLKDNSIGIEATQDGFQFYYAGKHTLKIAQPKQKS